MTPLLRTTIAQVYREHYAQTFRLTLRAIDAAMPGISPVNKRELARDVVQDAAEYVFFRVPQQPRQPAALWVAVARAMVNRNVRKAHERVHDVRSTGPKKQAKCFPSQIFGCTLADAFNAPSMEAA